MLSHKVPKGIEQITFSEKKGEIIAEIRCKNRFFLIHISLDGVDRLSRLYVADDLPEMVYASGAWTDDDTLKVIIRYLETPFTVTYNIRGHLQGIELTAYRWQFPEVKTVEYIKICSI